MDDTLDELRRLAAGFLEVPDDRPESLRRLPSARDEGQTQFGRYYRYFWEVAKRFRPAAVLEIGTYYGVSAAHFAAASCKPLVVTIDIDAEAGRKAKELGWPNVVPLTGDSERLAAQASRLYPEYDILFVDAVHDYEHCVGDYLRYRPLVRPGGLIFFDDISMHDGMVRAWAEVADPKVALPELHYTGFGVAVKDPGVRVPEARPAKGA